MKQSFHCFMNVKCYSNQIVSIGRERMPRLNVLQRATIIVLTKNGLSQRQIAEQVGCSKTAVKKTQDISQDIIRNLINSMPRRIEAVIKARGGHTSY